LGHAGQKIKIKSFGQQNEGVASRRRNHAPVRTDLDFDPGFYPVRPRSFAALSLKMPGFTSSRMAIFSTSDIQRSGVSTGKSVPKSILCFSSVFAYWMRIGGKYFGDQPDKSM